MNIHMPLGAYTISDCATQEIGVGWYKMKNKWELYKLLATEGTNSIFPTN